MNFMSPLKKIKKFIKKLFSFSKIYLICFFLLSIDLALVSLQFQYISTCITLISIICYQEFIETFNDTFKPLHYGLRKGLLISLCIIVEIGPHASYRFIEGPFKSNKDFLTRVNDYIKSSAKEVPGGRYIFSEEPL